MAVLPWLSKMYWIMITFDLKHSVQTSHLCWYLMPWMFLCASPEHLYSQFSCLKLCRQGHGHSWWYGWIRLRFLWSFYYRLDTQSSVSEIVFSIKLQFTFFAECLIIDCAYIYDSAGVCDSFLWLNCMWASSCGLSATVSSRNWHLKSWLSIMRWSMITFQFKHYLQNSQLCWYLMLWMFSMCFSRSSVKFML